MAQFATADDFAARIGRTLTADEQTRADTLLALASGMIQSVARQTIEQVTDDTLTRSGTPNDRVRLPERPVTAVSSVTLDGTALVEGTDWYRVDDCLVCPRGFGYPSQTLVVVYTHGFETVPDVVRAVCLDVVARVWVNPGSVMQESYGLERVIYSVQDGPASLELTDREAEIVQYVLRRQAGTAQFR